MYEITNYQTETHGTRRDEVTRMETYRGHVVELVTTQHPGSTHTYECDGVPQVRHTPARTSLSARIDSRDFNRPVGDDEAVLRKLRAGLDTDEENREMLPRLERAMHLAAEAPHRGIEVGELASVYAMGRSRTGHVVKLTARKATIAFTTPSSGGRVYRKAADLV